jgi:acetyl-CoA C-acetyltransferase
MRMAGALKNKVAIIGVGCTAFGELYDKSAEDLIYEAAFEALADAQVEPTRIQAAWVGTVMSQLGGDALGDALKLHNIPITRVQNYCASGMDAFRGACLAVAAGACDVALAVGFEKMRDGGFNRPARVHPVVDYGERAPHVFALAAHRYFKQYGASKTTLAKVAVKNHHHGTLSPKAHLRMDVTEETVLKAPLIYSPLGLFDCCPTTDGAAAAVVCRTDLAKQFRGDPIYVKAVELAVVSGQPYYKPSFDYLSFAATREAAARAYANAGITPRDVDFAEVHDCFTITEIINCEDLEFCRRGEGGRFVEEGHSALGGRLPVNPSGGLKSFGHPVGATGVRMIYELTQQLRHQAGARQVPDAEVGLAHNLGGPAAVSCVSILGNSP